MDVNRDILTGPDKHAEDLVAHSSEIEQSAFDFDWNYCSLCVGTSVRSRLESVFDLRWNVQSYEYVYAWALKPVVWSEISRFLAS